MNIELVRKVDYWAGIPVCFLLTVVERLLGIFSLRHPPSKDPKKFLFIELSEMGSAILAYPAMRLVKNEYKDAELFFMIFEKNRASVDLLGIVPKENVLTISDKSLVGFFFDVVKNVYRLNKRGIDVTFDLELFARATAILTYLSGAPKRVGLCRYRMEGLYRGSLLTHRMPYNFGQHISKLFVSFVRALDLPEKSLPTMESTIPDDDIEPAVYEPTKEGTDSIMAKLTREGRGVEDALRLIILNPSAGEIPIRGWPVENFIELGRMLLQDPGVQIVVTGIEGDRPVAEKVCDGLGQERCVNFVGKTTLAELLDLYCVTDVLITNDSGPAHFASLTPIKNFVFFGPEAPILYAPLGERTSVLYSGFPCSPCLTAFNHRNTACVDNRCLQAITPEEVHEKILAVLSRDR